LHKLIYIKGYTICRIFIQILREIIFSINVVLNCKESDFDLWHCRLGHPSEKICKTFSYVHSDLKIDVYDIYHFAKQHKLPFPQSNTKSLDPFNLIHVDIWRPISIPSVHGHRYFLIVIDDYTRHTWISFIINKSETRTLLYNFVMYVKNQLDHNIKTIRSDNGKELFSMNCMINLVFYIKDLVLKPLNKILSWRGNINTFLT